MKHPTSTVLLLLTTRFSIFFFEESIRSLIAFLTNLQLFCPISRWSVQQEKRIPSLLLQWVAHIFLNFEYEIIEKAVSAYLCFKLPGGGLGGGGVLGALDAGSLAHAARVVPNSARPAPPPVAGVACLAFTRGPVVRLCRVERTADSTAYAGLVPGVVLGCGRHAALADAADALEVGVAHALGGQSSV